MSENNKNKCHARHTECVENESTSEIKIYRRDLLKNIVGTGMCLATGVNLVSASTNADASTEEDPASLAPQEGDYLVHAEGDNEGELVDFNQLEENKKYITAWPKDAETGTIRNGSRFNKLLAIRLNPEELNQKTKAFSTENGVVVYSGICTHEGCDISAWVEDKKRLFCYCHYSQFDPTRFGKVTYGPARKKLPLLPIELDGSAIKVAGNFTRNPGGAKK